MQHTDEVVMERGQDGWRRVAWTSILVIDFTFQERIYVRIRRSKRLSLDKVSCRIKWTIQNYLDLRHGEMAGFGREFFGASLAK
jgi:hypothetical protein